MGLKDSKQAVYDYEYEPQVMFGRVFAVQMIMSTN